MKRLLLEDVLADEGLKLVIEDFIIKGCIFIYPTDTVYGMGCNAKESKSVICIRGIKGTEHPFSVIAPSNEWIRKNLKIRHSSYLKKLPGPYTLIFEKKRKGYLPDAAPGNSLGVRIPNHPFTGIVSEAGVPFITTSANVSGQPTITSVSKIPEKTLGKVDFVIDGGKLDNNPSCIIDLTGDEPVTIRK